MEASNPEDEAFVVNFSDEAYIDQEFTSNVNKLRDGLSHIESRGGTALYDAVVASADKLVADAKRPKQVLVLITDGEDNASTLNLEQTIRRVQELSGPVIYSIGLLFGDEMSHAEVRHARRALEMLSNETGGIAFFPKSIEQVDEISAEVARDIRSQYTIGYHSTKPSTEPGFRRVQVTAEAPGMGKLTVRTKSGTSQRCGPGRRDSWAQRGQSDSPDFIQVCWPPTRGCSDPTRETCRCRSPEVASTRTGLFEIQQLEIPCKLNCHGSRKPFHLAPPRRSRYHPTCWPYANASTRQSCAGFCGGGVCQA